MLNEKQLKQEIDKLTDQLRRAEEIKEEQQHEGKKALLETKTKLEFQTNRADQYQAKYKAALQYKNQQESLRQLTQKLGQKQNEILKLLKTDHQKSQQIKLLMQQNESLRNQKGTLSDDLSQIKEAALSAIMDKDTTISDLSIKLEEFQDNEGMNNIRADILELQEKYRELEQKHENTKVEHITLLEQKDTQINQLQQRLAQIKDKNDERVARLQNQILQYEKHIDQITALKDHQQNFQEKYYHTEEKLRKTEKKMAEFEQIAIEQRNQLVQAITKMQQQTETFKAQSEQFKELKARNKELDKQLTTKRREFDQTKERLEKSTADLNKKIGSLQSQRKLIGDNLNIKQQQIDRLKAELQIGNKETLEIPKNEPSLKKVTSSSNLASPTKRQDDLVLIEKLKKQNKDLEDTNEKLKSKIEEQTKQLQDLRQKLLATSGGQSSSQATKLRLTIQDLTSYLKKVQNDMLMKKITHAQDENFWSIKQKKYKNQIETLNKKYKKQNSQLLQRIDRMKKLIPKDKKTDYYQSGFK